ncbi:MAG: class I SAM-dependent methyltransferase [Roseburia sp.]|nr:class I SAM-dependent methyltransferase [Roseburia sp.]
MNRKELMEQWLAEEQVAHIHGWDFSHIHGRYEEENDLPWNYKEIIRKYLKPEHRILDIDTGGGEFLLSLKHPYENISATEAYPPNVQLCRETLIPLGIDFREADGDKHLPFPDESFDIVINRHGEYHAAEIGRVLKSGGIFITQQVGAENDRELVELILNEVPELPFPEQYLNIAVKKFEQNGFTIWGGEEVFRPIKFYDVGALVWFAHIIEWEFPNFNVQDSLEKLFKAQEILEENGYIEGRIHRFVMVAKKL